MGVPWFVGWTVFTVRMADPAALGRPFWQADRPKRGDPAYLIACAVRVARRPLLGCSPTARARGAQKTTARMIVHHTDRLQEGIDDGRADEAKSPPLEVLRDFIAKLGARWNVPAAPRAVEQRYTVHE